MDTSTATPAASTQYTVKQGDSLNAIAAAHGYSDYKSANIQGYGSDPNKITPGMVLTIGAGKAAPITTTPPVISSKDAAAGFASDSAALNGKIPPPVVPGTGGTGTTATPNTGTDASATAIEKGAKSGAGTGAEPVVSSGDPIYDSLQTWEKAQQDKNAQNAADQKAQITNLLQTNLAATDATYAAQITGIGNTYGNLIDLQTQINDLNVGRVKAYGLASGNAMSTPLEFTNAVTGSEQAALSAMQKLDNERDSLIASAKAANQAADAKLLSDSMTSIAAIEKNMNDQAAQLQQQLDARYASLNKIKADQQAQLKLTQQNLMAAAITKYGTQFNSETDPAKKDALIKNIITQSGGALDYGTVLGSFASASAAALDAASKKADIGLKGAQTAEAFANAAKTGAANKQAAVFSAVDAALGKDANGNPVTIPGTKGVPFTDQNGYLTKKGFDSLQQGAHENGVERASFLKEYGGYLDPGGYANYGLTRAEQDALNNVNKAVNVVIPQAPQAPQATNDGTH